MLKRVFASPVMKIGLAIVLILAIVLSIPATRALADQLLGLFRVQQVVVVPVDFNGIKQLTGNSSLGNQISQFISSSTTVEQKPGNRSLPPMPPRLLKRLVSPSGCRRE